MGELCSFFIYNFKRGHTKVIYKSAGLWIDNRPVYGFSKDKRSPFPTLLFQWDACFVKCFRSKENVYVSALDDS